jgi:hypothetical protein
VRRHTQAAWSSLARAVRSLHDEDDPPGWWIPIVAIPLGIFLIAALIAALVLN